MFDSLTVVIPTYNRSDLLAKALEGYSAQSSPVLIRELLVVDDGSSDDTDAMVQTWIHRSPFPLRYLRQPNRGPAAARNFGIREAHSSVVLFTDSDIIPERDLVEQHLQAHNANPQVSSAVLGYVTWSPEVRVTPFMRWYGERGALFAYGQFRRKRELDFRFFYTCNLSLKTDFLRSSGQFDEEFRSANFEDIELGYRLAKNGMRLVYNPQAVAYHYQSFTFDEACRKALANAPARKLFLKKEAGQHVLAQREERMSGIRLWIAKHAATGVAAIIGTPSRILDSKFPLPSPIYRSLYWYRVNRRLEMVDP
jgi:GT2 family glycosyltransferase